MKKTLYCLGEEQVSFDIVNLFNWICKDITINEEEFKYELIETDKKLSFEIKGLSSEKYDKFVYILISRDGNGFVDFLFYEGNESPTENDKPIAAAEATKNSGKEAGNMIAQRSPKKIAIFEKWGDIPYTFFIANPNPIEKTIKTFSQTHNCEFATITAEKFGTSEITISQIDKFGYKVYTPPFKYSKLEDIVTQEDKRKGKAEPNFESKTVKIPYRVFNRNNRVELQASLYKSKGNNDPGEGYIASRAFLVRELEPNKEIVLINHKQNKKFFEKTNNKLINALKSTGVTVEFPDGTSMTIEKEEGIYNKPYWKYANKGEKIGTIYMEQYFLKLGYEVLFTNHAGCGKSYISFDGKSYKTKQGVGIPDLVLYKRENNKLLVIEGEQSKNYKKGLKQVKNVKFNEFIVREFLSILPQGVDVCKYLCTYGDYNNEPEVIFNLTEDFEVNINMGAQKI
jgi:hypothetical protein